MTGAGLSPCTYSHPGSCHCFLSSPFLRRVLGDKWHPGRVKPPTAEEKKWGGSLSTKTKLALFRQPKVCQAHYNPGNELKHLVLLVWLWAPIPYSQESSFTHIKMNWWLLLSQQQRPWYKQSSSQQITSQSVPKGGLYTSGCWMWISHPSFQKKPTSTSPGWVLSFYRRAVMLTCICTHASASRRRINMLLKIILFFQTSMYLSGRTFPSTGLATAAC